MRESRFDGLMLVNSLVGLVTAVLSWSDVQPGLTRPVFVLSLLLVVTGQFLRRFVVRPRPADPSRTAAMRGARRLGE